MAWSSLNILTFIILYFYAGECVPFNRQGFVFEQYGTSGLVQLPPYIKNERTGFQCLWRFRAPETFATITVNIDRLKLSRRFVDCTRGYLMVSDLQGKTVEKLCGGAHPRSIIVQGNGADVKYFAKKTSHRTLDFSATWSASIENYDNKSCGTSQGFIGSRRNRYMTAGIPIPSQMFPWVVKIVVYFHESNSIEGEWSCSGTLINTKWILTSITCAFPDKIIKKREVHLGSGSDYRVIDVAEARMYPFYNGEKSHDVALVRLDKPVSITYSIRPACLVDQLQNVGGSCWIADVNRGSSSISPTLKVTQIQVWQGCLKTKSTVCTMYVQKPGGTCRGSTGGALMCSDDKGIVGIHGVLSRKPGECGSQFEGFVNLNYYQTWITGIINGQEPNLPGMYESNFIDPIHNGSNENH